jgi:hypothetical protein
MTSIPSTATPAPGRATAPFADPLSRLSGVSLALGGTMAAGAFLFMAVVDPTGTGHAEAWWIPAQFSVILGGMFMALGIPGFHATQAERTGVLGLVATVLLFAGLVLAYVGVHATQILSQPSVPERMGQLVAIAAPSLAVGTALTAVVTWRAGVLPRRASAPLLGVVGLGALAFAVAMPVWLVPALFAASMAWLGLALARLGP